MTLHPQSAVDDEVAYDSGEILGWVTEVFRSLDMTDEDARTLADSLMFAETRGVNSHGLSRIPVYVSRLRAGGINPQPQISRQRAGAVCVVDGDAGAGAPVTMQASRIAAEIAVAEGVSVVLVRNVGHAGALAFYATWLSERGLVAIIASNADPIMVPPGGGRSVLGSNPLAIAVPAPSDGETAPMLDMATTAAAHGKVVMAAARGEAIPAGWAVDAGGSETTDAHQALKGALMPAAGAKGFGLAFMIDVLAAGLTGGRTGQEIVPLYSRLDEPQGACLFLIVIDPEHCAGRSSLRRATQRVADAVRRSRIDTPIAGVPMIPGEPELRRLQSSGTQVRIPRAVVAEILAACGELAGSLPDPINTDS